MASISSKYLFNKNNENKRFSNQETALDYVTSIDLEPLLLENGHGLDRAVVLYEREGRA